MTLNLSLNNVTQCVHELQQLVHRSGIIDTSLWYTDHSLPEPDGLWELPFVVVN